MLMQMKPSGIMDKLGAIL